MYHVAKRHPAGFTLVELIIVITVMALILAIAIPGLSAMGTESRYNAAVQTVNGALLRAYYTALADRNVTAVRFLPGEWDNDETASGQQPSGRQHIVTYSYVATSVDPADATMQTIRFDEYFQRRAGSASVQLPEGIWVAPIEALDDQPRSSLGANINFGAQFTLDGEPGEFYLDAVTAPWDGFQKADDFMIVFDPQAGMRSVISPMMLRAYIPPPPDGPGPLPNGVEASEWPVGSHVYFRRYNFSGVTFYRREAFLSLGRGDDLGYERQRWLKQNSRPYLVHRFSGGLVMGTQGIDTE